eukprot:GHRQ01016889.1.p1 GENE.GHRQ01016889.1~~GHRQ01016889.1.p1  ORF type:complete len:145 (+),score=3.95 GHRQ01016889.1:202-636(+)
MCTGLTRAVTQDHIHTLVTPAVILAYNRDEIADLLKLDDVIDLVIPRGGNALVSHIQVSHGCEVTPQWCCCCNCQYDNVTFCLRVRGLPCQAVLQPSEVVLPRTLLCCHTCAKVLSRSCHAACCARPPGVQQLHVYKLSCRSSS